MSESLQPDPAIGTVGHSKRNLNPIEIGQRLRQLRGEISQADYAEALDVAQATVSRCERGERMPDVDMVMAACRRAGVEVEWLLTGHGRGLAAGEG